MAHIGLSDIESALRNSGLPLGSADEMRNAAPAAGSVLEGSIPGSGVPDMGYKAKLDQIAAMDQKLSKLYSDPTSSMYIENPMNREQLVSGASSQGYREAGDIAQQRQQAAREEEQKRNDLIAESEQYYKALVAIQDREEKALDKATPKSKGGSGVKRTKTTAIEEMAGFADPEAAKVWSSQLNADQKRRWLQAMSEGTILDQDLRIGDGLPPEGGYTVEDVMDFYANERARAQAAKKKKASGSGTVTLESLLNSVQ